MSFDIREIRPDDWEQFKAIRLRMLAEIPLAYGETLASAERMTDAQWRSRVKDYADGNSIRLGAVVEDGSWVGTMGGFLSPLDGNQPVLVGVYVAPGFRGSDSGVTDALIARVEEWARAWGTRLLLHVHEDNARAIAAYAKRGFVNTGVTIPYELDRTQTEYEMAKPL